MTRASFAMSRERKRAVPACMATAKVARLKEMNRR
jgi:hypothetical protein